MPREHAEASRKRDCGKQLPLLRLGEREEAGPSECGHVAAVTLLFAGVVRPVPERGRGWGQWLMVVEGLGLRWILRGNTSR